jgi:hypothetical protein
MVLVITGEMIGEIVALAAGMALTAASFFQNFLMAHHNTVPSATNAAMPKPNTHCLFWTTQFHSHIVSIVLQFRGRNLPGVPDADRVPEIRVADWIYRVVESKSSTNPATSTFRTPP